MARFIPLTTKLTGKRILANLDLIETIEESAESKQVQIVFGSYDTGIEVREDFDDIAALIKRKEIV